MCRCRLFFCFRLFYFPIDTIFNQLLYSSVSIFQVLISKEYLQLEPIGLVFVFFFALILVIQFSAMLFHRFGTISHILASTELNWFFSKKVNLISSFSFLFSIVKFEKNIYFFSLFCRPMICHKMLYWIKMQ